MSVTPFDPAALRRSLDDAALAEFLAAAGRLDEPDFGLSTERVAALAPLARHQDAVNWRTAAESLDDEAIIRLIRLFTLAERLPGWEAGERSPVVSLAAVLRGRGAYPESLTAWIRANSQNRFLPYGSLLDRL